MNNLKLLFSLNLTTITSQGVYLVRISKHPPPLITVTLFQEAYYNDWKLY